MPPCTDKTLRESLHFNGHFPGGPGLAGTRMSPVWILWKLRVMDVVVTTGTIRHQNSNEIVTSNKPPPNVLQAGCPSCCPSNSVKALKGYGKERINSENGTL